MTTNQLDRIEHLLLSQYHLINFWSARLMADITELQTKIDELTAAAAADRARAEAGAAQVTLAVSLLQALTATIADLKAQVEAGNAVTQEQIDSLTSKANAALGDLTSSAATESAADAQLGAGVSENTPEG